jgi:hypothetical protein
VPVLPPARYPADRPQLTIGFGASELARSHTRQRLRSRAMQSPRRSGSPFRSPHIACHDCTSLVMPKLSAYSFQQSAFGFRDCRLIAILIGVSQRRENRFSRIAASPLLILQPHVQAGRTTLMAISPLRIDTNHGTSCSAPSCWRGAGESVVWSLSGQSHPRGHPCPYESTSPFA